MNANIYGLLAKLVFFALSISGCFISLNGQTLADSTTGLRLADKANKLSAHNSISNKEFVVILF